MLLKGSGNYLSFTFHNRSRRLQFLTFSEKSFFHKAVISKFIMLFFSVAYSHVQHSNLVSTAYLT